MLPVPTMHPDLACNWMGVGGKVMDADNNPLPFQTVQLGGILDGKAINDLKVSGSKSGIWDIRFRI